jgi:hypothetical protein
VRGEPIERVIRRADTALLDAKGSGRNRVVIAERPADLIAPLKEADQRGLTDRVRDHARIDAANDSLAQPGREPVAD